MAKLLAWVLLCCASLAQGAEQSWDELVAAAKREGRVVVLGPPDTQLRQNLSNAFKARFGVAVEYISGRGSALGAKLRLERSAGVYSADVAIAGVDTMSTVFYHEKMLAPLRPALVLPEVLDGSKWKKGKLWFVDPEQQYVLRLMSTVQNAFHINTREVKPDDLRSARDLLNPKWKGKISADDPGMPGSGSNTSSRLYLQFGEEFVKKLYIDQKPMISRDRRQLTDWLLRGTYPIAFSVDDDQVDGMRKEGFPVKEVVSLPDMPASLSAGNGHVALFNQAPHPNAAKIFVNWLASKEGLELYARAVAAAPTRSDIDVLALGVMPAQRIPQPGINYFDTSDWEFNVTQRPKLRILMQEMMKLRHTD
ncbi:MAG: extracellular solute-binding protein [Burkholderiales bacterium]|nr:extracellular solute-binding protein [Burkholderiales bacterium]